MRYDIVPYTPEFDAQILVLQRYLGSTDEKLNAAYLKWKYTDNPYLRDRLMYLALDEGRVVGVRGMFGTLWQVDDGLAAHLLAYSDDLVVAPEHRNRGLVGQMMKAAIDDLARRGFPFAISMSAGPITYLSALTLGWRAVGSYEPARHIFDAPARARRSRVRTMLGHVSFLRPIARRRRVQQARGLFQNLDEAGAGDSGISLSSSPRCEAMAELIARLPWDGRIRHVRDARYFAWRFRNPHHEYRFLFAGGERLDGYLVLHRYATDGYDLEQVNIVDWEGTDEQVRAALLEATLRRGQFARLHTWTASLPDSTRSLLEKNGFETRVGVRHQGLLVRRVGDGTYSSPWRFGSRDPLRIENWDLRMLYSMAG